MDEEVKGMYSAELKAFLKEWNDSSDAVLVHTSGSTGTPKPMWVEKHRMEASARLTCDFLHLRQGDTALLCMPLQYIAGKMVVVRSLVRGLRLVEVTPSGHPLAGLSESPTFAAMVPMQVYNSLRVPRERELLEGIRHLIIGGGAVDEAMERELRHFPGAVWSTYGMTETLSHIAMRRISGESASAYYTPMEGVEVTLSERGTLRIYAPHVCTDRLTTNDVAEIREDGSFRILGRIDNVVCSGGIKIQIEEVEQMLVGAFERREGHLPRVGERMQLTGVADAKFGQRLVALVECEPAVWQPLADELPTYYRPKQFLQVGALQMTETGKPRRAWAAQLASELLEKIVQR